MTAEAAEVLGKAEDAAALHDLLANIKQAFNKAYVAPDGRIKGHTQACYVLAKIGRNDVAYQLIHNETFPSWGFSIQHGATTIWERWDGWTPEKGFQNAGMSSFAHYSFGAVYQWMVENMGGIQAVSAAYKTIRIQPAVNDARTTWANVSYDSIRGRIASAWKKDAGQYAARRRFGYPATSLRQSNQKQARDLHHTRGPIPTYDKPVAFARTTAQNSG